MNIEYSKWKFLSLNPRLFNKFLEQITTNFTDYEFEIYLDPELKTNKIIIKEQFIDILKSNLPQIYFYKDKIDERVGKTTPYIDIDQFLKYKKEMKEISIKENSFVRFTADGQLYVVDSIDLLKNKCVITKVGNIQKISLKVPLEMVVPTLKQNSTI